MSIDAIKKLKLRTHFNGVYWEVQFADKTGYFFTYADCCAAGLDDIEDGKKAAHLLATAPAMYAALEKLVLTIKPAGLAEKKALDNALAVLRKAVPND